MARDRGHAAQKRAIDPQKDMTFGRAEQTKWMQRSSTALRDALLGVPLKRRGDGADLGNRLATRLGETWRVNIETVSTGWLSSLRTTGWRSLARGRRAIATGDGTWFKASGTPTMCSRKRPTHDPRTALLRHDLRE